jgi:hypothetical protein
MSDGIQVHAKPHRADVVRAVRYVLMTSSSGRWLVWGSVIGWPALLLMYVAFRDPATAAPVQRAGFVPGLLAALAILAVLLLVTPLLALRAPAIKELVTHGVHWRFAPDGVEFSGRESRGRLEWTALSEARRKGDLYLLRLRLLPQAVHIVPRRDFRSPEDESTFRALLLEKMGGAARV